MRDVIQVTKRSCEIPMFRPCPHTPTKTLWIYEAFRGCIEELSCSGKPVDGTFLTKEDCVKSCVTLHWHVKSDSVLQSLQRSDWAIQTNLQPNHQKGFPQNLNLTGWQNYWHQEMCQVQDVAHNFLVVRCDSISNIHPPRWVRLSDDSICEKQLQFFSFSFQMIDIHNTLYKLTWFFSRGRIFDPMNIFVTSQLLPDGPGWPSIVENWRAK